MNKNVPERLVNRLGLTTAQPFDSARILSEDELTLPDPVDQAVRSNRRTARRALAHELSYGRHFGPPSVHARPAAVLILLYPHQDQWHIPLLVRPAGTGIHAGQVSFPGGMLKSGESSSDGALREFSEEMGEPPPVQRLGRLDECYVYASNFRIVPWVGVANSRPLWKPNPREVSELLEIPIPVLLSRRPEECAEFSRGPVSFSAPCYAWKQKRIWGATGMILAELLSLISDLEW